MHPSEWLNIGACSLINMAPVSTSVCFLVWASCLKNRHPEFVLFPV